MNESFVTITHFLDESLSNLYSILLDPKEKVKYHQKVLSTKRALFIQLNISTDTATSFLPIKVI